MLFQFRGRYVVYLTSVIGRNGINGYLFGVHPQTWTLCYKNLNEQNKTLGGPLADGIFNLVLDKTLFFKEIYSFSCVCVLLWWACHVYAGSCTAQKRQDDQLGLLLLEVVNHSWWVIGIELESFRRSISSLNYWTIFPVLKQHILTMAIEEI